MSDISLAMHGDQEAADRLTNKGELLPCPCCGRIPVIRYTTAGSKNGYTSNIYMRSKAGYVICLKCGLQTSKHTRVCRSVRNWNTRQKTKEEFFEESK